MDYNNLFFYHDGHLYWIDSPHPEVQPGDRAGTLRADGYIGIFYKRVYLFEHRLIYERFKGPIPKGKLVDHVDRIRSHNHPDNLRLSSIQENARNRGPQSNNKSGYKGVSWHKQKGKWVAQIKVEGRNKFLGFFDDPQEAYAKYCATALLYYGEFAFID